MKISIITINRNNKDGLRLTIESVVGQSFGDFEYIVIDGASTDGSLDVIKEYSNKINYSVSEKDAGIYNAMNKGVKAAKGDYVLFLNSGDRFCDSGVLGKANDLLKDNKEIYYGNMIKKSGAKELEYIPPSKLNFGFLLYSSLPHPSSFIKRSLFYDHFFYNESFKIVSDWEFFLYLICKQNVSYKHLDLFVSVFDTNGISLGPDSDRIKDEECLVTMKKYFPAFIDDYKELKTAKATLNSEKVKTLLYVEKFSFARKLLALFLRTCLYILPKQK